MKIAGPLVGAFVSLAAVANADGNNATTTSVEGDAHEAAWDCWPSVDSARSWFYNTRGEGPYRCTTNHDTQSWSMLSAYRSGGTEGVHWKYTDNENDPECLKWWKYYSANGQTLIAEIWSRTTTQNDSRRWCALPVYRPGGVLNKQWEYCECGWSSTIPHN